MRQTKVSQCPEGVLEQNKDVPLVTIATAMPFLLAK